MFHVKPEGGPKVPRRKLITPVKFPRRHTNIVWHGTDVLSYPFNIKYVIGSQVIHTNGCNTMLSGRYGPPLRVGPSGVIHSSLVTFGTGVILE